MGKPPDISASSANNNSSRQASTPTRPLPFITSPSLRRSNSSLLGNPEKQQDLYSSEAIAAEIYNNTDDGGRDLLQLYSKPGHIPISKSSGKLKSGPRRPSLSMENEPFIPIKSINSGIAERAINLSNDNTTLAPYNLSDVKTTFHDSRRQATHPTSLQKQVEVNPQTHDVVENTKRSSNIQGIFAHQYFATMTYFVEYDESKELHEILHTSAGFDCYRVQAKVPQFAQKFNWNFRGRLDNELQLPYRAVLSFHSTSGNNRSLHVSVECNELLVLQQLRRRLLANCLFQSWKISVGLYVIAYRKNNMPILVKGHEFPVLYQNTRLRNVKGAADLLFFLAMYEANSLLKFSRLSSAYCRNDSTPLHVAVSQGSLKLVRCLLHIVSTSSRDDGLNTPLHISASLDSEVPDNMRIVSLLVKNGADNTVFNAVGKTPWDIAVKNASWSADNLLNLGARKSFERPTRQPSRPFPA